MGSLQNNEKKKRIPHILAGFVILVHAYAKFEERNHSYIFFLIAGIVFLSVAIFHHKLLHRFPLVDIVFFIIEAVLSFIIAYEYFELGKKGLPFVYLFAGLVQLFAIYLFIKKKKRQVG